MQSFKFLSVFFLSAITLLAVTGCGGGGGPESGVTIQGVVDDGLASSPIAGAECRFVSERGRELGSTTADSNGEFSLVVAQNSQGFLVCNPPGQSNLRLVVFVSTVGALAGETLPVSGREELSPAGTLITEIIIQEQTVSRSQRKAQLMQELQDGANPELTMLAMAATELFNAQLADTDASAQFSSAGSDLVGQDTADEASEDGESDDGGGDNADAGDGGDLSPLAGAMCQFERDENGDSALEDLLADGVVDLLELQTIASLVAQDPAIQNAFMMLFPNGIQPLRNGEPIRGITDANGSVFLPTPRNTEGRITCTDADTGLSVSGFLPARMAGDRRTGENFSNISPASQFFIEGIASQLAGLDIPPVQANYADDIGDLTIPSAGIVRVETTTTADGEIVADADGDGIVCSFTDPTLVQGPPIYPAAAAAAFTSAILYKALLVEQRQAATETFATLLQTILTRTDAAGGADVMVLPADLEAGGVPVARSTLLADILNDCIADGVVGVIGGGTAAALPDRMVRAGRLRVRVQNPDGPVPNARVSIASDGIVTLGNNSSCPAPAGSRVDDNSVEDNRIECLTSADTGTVTFVLLAQNSLEPVTLTLTATSEDGMQSASAMPVFAAPATIDLTIDLTTQ